MRCIKCLFKNLITHHLFLVFVPVLSFFGLLLSSSSVSALSWSYSASSVVIQIGSGSSAVQTTANFDASSRGWDYTLPNMQSIQRIIMRFGNADFNTNVKPNLSGNQYFNIAFGFTTDYYSTLNSVGTISEELPVITSMTVSPSCDTENQRIYGFTSNGEFFYPSGGGNIELVANCYYHVSITGYVPNSSEWNGTVSLGGAILSNRSGANSYTTFYRPTINLYDEPSQQTTNAISEQTAQDKQYHDEQQQASDDAQSDANTGAEDAGQQAEDSGTSLLQAFIDFVGAITGASPSNCVISANMGNLDLGNIDLCQISPPPAFQVISSIILVGFFVPLAVAGANLFLSTVRSFQK